MCNRVSGLAALVLLVFFFTGCVATSPQQEIATSSATEATGSSDGGSKTSCEATLEELIKQASTTRRTTKGSCEGLRIEATPMWNMNYDGTVHLRVFDQTGKVIRDEKRKP